MHSNIYTLGHCVGSQAKLSEDSIQQNSVCDGVCLTPHYVHEVKQMSSETECLLVVREESGHGSTCGLQNLRGQLKVTRARRRHPLGCHVTTAAAIVLRSPIVYNIIKY